MNSHTIALNLHSELKIPYYSVVKDQICYSSAPCDDQTAAKLFQAPASAVACIEHLWWSGPGLNRQPSACKADALPIELPPRYRPHKSTETFTENFPRRSCLLTFDFPRDGGPR